MKKFLIGTTLAAALFLNLTSCGGGQKCEVDNDTIVSQELTDSMSRALGAFMGANLRDEVRYTKNIDEYIEGYQLLAGHKYSYEELMGIRAGLYVAEQFAAMRQQGVEINRDLFLQEFRKYIQALDLDNGEYAVLYKNFQDVLKAVDEILLRREQMRNMAALEENVPVTLPDSLLVEEIVDVNVDEVEGPQGDALVDEDYEQIAM